MQTAELRQPILTDLLVYVTDYCNLKCRHCYYVPRQGGANGERSGEISYQQICQVVDELLPFGLQRCKLSGGEPFLRNDLLDVCRFLDSRSVRVLLETNGTLVGRHEANSLARLNQSVSISVSLDGVEAKTHEWLRRTPGCFRDAVRGLEHLVAAGIKPVQVIASLFEGNRKELPRLMEFVHAKGANSFKLNVIAPAGRGKTFPAIDVEDILTLDSELANHARNLGLGYAGPIPPALLPIGRLMECRCLGGRCNIHSTLGILADGTITTCGMGRYAEDFCYGKLGEESVSEIWVNHPVLRTIRARIPRDLGGTCGRCVLRTACLGVCRLLNEDVTLDRLCDPFWFCAEMESRGRFPRSRTMSPAKDRCFPVVGA